MNHYILLYTYVPDILEKREPHRPAHLASLRDLHASGTVVMAGATGDPVDGAAIVFRAPSPETAADFAETDPYVVNGLVTSWRVVPWTVVVGAP